MNPKLISIILNSVEVNCPLCKFKCHVKSNTFRCRTRYTLRNHLNKSHNEIEAEEYVKKII